MKFFENYNEFKLYELAAPSNHSQKEWIDLIRIYWSHFYEVFKKNKFDHIFSADLDMVRIADRLGINKTMMAYINAHIFDTEGKGAGSMKKLKVNEPPTDGDASEAFLAYTIANRKGAKGSYDKKKKEQEELDKEMSGLPGKVFKLMNDVYKSYMAYSSPSKRNSLKTQGELKFTDKAKLYNIKDQILLQELKWGELVKDGSRWQLKYPKSKFTLDDAKNYIKLAKETKKDKDKTKSKKRQPIGKQQVSKKERFW